MTLFFSMIYIMVFDFNMGQYVKKALVLGAGGFIGSHMVRRLRSEGYWVRGVDLKHPDFACTDANEFVQGDLRDVTFVRRAIQFKGERGNFYNEIPYQMLESVSYTHLRAHET